MDANLIFHKTPLGEQAMLDRARLSQRDLRTVLILVDGKRTVAEISESRGNVRATESILGQLEQQGFIEPIAGHASESELERTTAQIADVFRRGTTGQVAEPVAAKPLAPKAPPPVENERREPTFGTLADGEIEPIQSIADDRPGTTEEVSPDTTSGEEEDARTDASISIAELAASIRDEIPELSAKPPETAPLPNPFASGPQSIPPQATQPRPGDTINPFGGGIASRQSAPVSDMEAPEPAQDPHRDLASVVASIPASRRKPVSFRLRVTPKGIAFTVGLLLVACVAGFLAYPIERSGVEQAISGALGQSITVGNVHTALSPAPTLVIERIKIGATGDLTVAEVRATPRMSSLFGGRTAFSNLTINGATVPVERLGTLASGIGALGNGAGVAVERVRFNGMKLTLRDASPQEFNGTADLVGTGTVSNLTLTRPDQTLKLQITGRGQEASVLIEGNGWSPSEGSPYVFEALVIEGKLSGTRFSANKIEGRLLGGAMNGALTIDWGNRLSLEGSVGSSFMPTRSFLQTLDSPLIIDGELSGRLRFHASADNWAALVKALPVEGDFVAKKGNIDGLDLVEAVRRAGGPPLRGGATKFDEIKGDFAYNGQQLRMTSIELSSGVVHATGRAAIDRAQGFSGSFDVLLRGSATQTRMPVALAGTLKDPELTGGRR